jgi:hypothetical protein
MVLCVARTFLPMTEAKGDGTTCCSAKIINMADMKRKSDFDKFAATKGTELTCPPKR